MLEGVVANLLNRFLGMYVKNFDAGQLNVGIWSGDVKLRNLELRREALDQLRLPLNVVTGFLGELTLSIPWSNLRGKPVKVDIQDVFLLAAPKEDATYDPEEEKKRQHAIKMEKLESIVLLKEQSPDGVSQEERLKNQSFTQSMVNAIVDNLQIIIKNVHFRYEDPISTPGHPFAVGMTLKELSAISTDADWNPTFIQSVSGTSHKLAILESLAVYWNTDVDLFGTGSSNQSGSSAISQQSLMEKLRRAILEESNNQFILKPVSGRAGIELDKTGRSDRPRAKARFLFDEFGLVIDDCQYRDALMLADLFHTFIRSQEYKSLRPKDDPKDAPRAWFRYAGEAVLSKIRERNRRWTPVFTIERRDSRLKYIFLYKKRKRQEILTSEEQQTLNELEQTLSYEDLRFWMSLARSQLRKENIEIQKSAPKQQTWSEWFWGSKKQEESTTITDEQRQELYDAIDWDEKKAITESVDYPRESVKFQVDSSLQRGSFTLKRDPQGKATEFVKLVFDRLRAKVQQRPDSFLFGVDLRGMRLYDGTTEGSRYPQVVRVKDAVDLVDPDIEPGKKILPSEEEIDLGIEDTLFHAQFERNPLDGSADSAISMTMKSIEIIYNPLMLSGISDFFKPPARHMDTVNALLETAGATVEEIRQQTRAGLEFALEEHRTLNAQLDIQAPLIIIPESIVKESSFCLIVDAGHASVNSELAPKEALKDIQAQGGNQEEFRQLVNLMYDKFLLKLDSTQVLIGPSIEAGKAQLSSKSPSMNYHIIDRINMDFIVELCILPQSKTLPRTRVSGHLQELHASMSDRKYKNLMSLVEVVMPQSSPEPVQDTTIRHERSQSFHQNELPDVEADSENGSAVSRTDNKHNDPANIEQKTFQFKFTVDTFRGSLYRSDQNDASQDMLLVELVANHFYLDFYLRPYDMVTELLLRSLSIEDHIERDPTPEFKNILSSKGFDSKQDRDLFNMKFMRINKDSPEFITKYNGVDMNLDVSISTINLIVTRRTLLTLLDFIMITFTNQGQQIPVEEVGKNESAIVQSKSQEQEPAPERKINIQSRLEGISLILNDDGTRLATLSLNTADIGVFLSNETLIVKARMGSLTLFDDLHKDGSSSTVRRLMSIEGDDFADFRYQAYYPQIGFVPEYSYEVFLRSGSVKINFIEESYHKIINFLVKFGKMRTIFNAARQAAANQASQIQESASLMRFDVVVKAPILVFPRITKEDRPRDYITANLGEFYASNGFSGLSNAKDSPRVNNVAVGIRHVRLTSNFYYAEEHSEELEIMENVDLDFKMSYLEHLPNMRRPDMQVEGLLSPINLRISQPQLKFLMELSSSVPAALMADQGQQEAEAIQQLSPALAHDSHLSPLRQSFESSVSPQIPEIIPEGDIWTKMDMSFKAANIGLELIMAEEGVPVMSLDDASLSKFFLSDSQVKLRMMSDGSLESELLVHSFNIRDSRSGEANRFRKIMSLINNDVQQEFMASISMTGGERRHLIAMLTIDSPRIIFELDYLSSLQAFAASVFGNGEESLQQPASEIEESEYTADSPVHVGSPASSATPAPAQSTSSFSVRVHIVDPQVILIANPTIPNTEAIVWGSKQLLFTHQNASTLNLTKVGMFLCRMDKFETSRLRILDDFGLEISMDSQTKGRGTMATRIDIHADPLVLRLSLRDILLAIQIINKASEMTTKARQARENRMLDAIKTKESAESAVSKRPDKFSRLSPSPSASRPSSLPRAQSSSIMKKEEMIAQFDGFRVILIGHPQELPLLDWSVQRFDVDIRDWSSTLSADTNINMFVNVYNFSKSAWEPLIEPWQLGFHLSKELSPDSLSFEVFSHKMMELSVTSATIALASKSLQFLSTEEDVLLKPRGSDAPYRIQNYTGFDLHVWSDVRGKEGQAARLADGEEHPWRFEDPTAMRENLTPEGNAGTVGIRLEGSGFDSIKRIPLIREGETLYNLKPKQNSVLHYLLVEVRLASNNVKYITFRSPLLVENRTQIPIDFGVYSPQDGNLLKIEKVLPGDARPAPVGAAYMYSLLVRPDQGFGYDWSNDHLFWKELLLRPKRTLSCRSEIGQPAPPFYFQMNATFDPKSPIHKKYPYMRIRIFAPIEIQNLLPYDFKYRIYDKHTRKDWTNFLRKGGVSPVHVVELSHLLLLNVDIQDTSFRQGEFAIINGNAEEDFRRESTLSVRGNRDIELKLGLHYFSIPDSGGAFKVSVFSPYLILNMTGMDLSLQGKTLFQSTKTALGHNIRTDSSTGVRRALPYMYSYSANDRSNRSILKIDSSEWSKPQSFEAIGSNYEVCFPSSTSKTEYRAGITVEEGAGKYQMTKIVTVAPRFILKNKLEEDLVAREPGSPTVINLKAGDLVPLQFLRRDTESQLCLCFPGVGNQWSSPFYISDLGSIYVKLAKANQRQRLLKVDILMEGATIFLYISAEGKHWPYSMRNESDTEFIFFQANPNLDDDDEEQIPDPNWRPIRYRLPPRSIMPYSWDYPASKNRSLILLSHGMERHIKLAEIGNLIPMKLPPSRNQPAKIIELNIVADGPTQTLVLSNFKPSKSIYRQRSAAPSSQTSLSTGFEVKEVKSNVSFKAQLRLGGIGVSLINQKLKELVYLTFRDFQIRYSDSLLYQTIETTVKWIQIDNQLYGGIFPILLYPSVVPKTGKEMEAHPIFQFKVTRVKDDSYGVLYIKYCTLLLQEMTIELDEDFIFALLEFLKVPGASWTEEKEEKLCDENLYIPEPKSDEQGRDVYFELLHLQPMQLDLSFVRTERVNVEDTMEFSSMLMFLVNVLTMSIGNVNDAPVRFNALLLDNARVSISALTGNVSNHYFQEFLRQIHLVIGSADLLGNPVGLFNNVSSGVVDIFYEPYQGLIMADRPHELGIGIAKGATSFLKKSVFGFSDSVAKFTGSVSKGLAFATLDKEFQDQRRMSKVRNKPKHALYGLTSGGNAFAASMASGIGGLARHPIEGAEKEGLQGFVKGIGKGFLGLATKPALGAFDLASNFAEGVRNTTTVFDASGLDRVRYPRFIGVDGVVRPYSPREALGQFWLKTADDGRYFNEDYIAHLEFPGRDMMVMLTYDRIMLLRSRQLTTEWDITLTDIQTISKERTGMGITLKGGTNGPFIPVMDETARNWLYRQIAIAVNAFNEKYIAKG